MVDLTPTSPSPVKFLLVDDLPENLLALEALLRRDGLELLTARSGREALELLLVHEIALALIDVQMPEMDGFDLAELMRGTERTRRVPIIFVTAGTPNRQRRFRGYEAGAVDFLTKPIEAHVLRSKAGVFFELWRERQEVARQRDELKLATAENARLLDETRRTAAALTEADRRKDEFIATLAHELRNPLAPLTSGLQILKFSSSPDALGRARDMMDRQLKHMVRLVDDLLDISRATSGKIRLRSEVVDIRSAVEAAVEATRHAIEAGKHTLSLHLPEENLLLKGDATRLAQIVGNLLTNAAKYTPDGGRIDVAVERTDTCVTLKVKDTGVGIPPDMLPKVFDLFTQVGKNIDRAQGGLGIGLSLVRKLVELHSGSVMAESLGSGKGSTFSVTFPLFVEGLTTEIVAVASKVEYSSSARRVLIVDDNVDGAESLSMLLTLSGHITAVAHSGLDGIEMARTFNPDIILLDLGLPEMDGCEVAKELRTQEAFKHVTLVALTGWGSDEDRRRTKEAGFDLHFTKPVDHDRLQQLFSNLSISGKCPS